MMTPLALIAACFLDLIFGDPEGFPHPVVLMGRLIAGLEGFARSITHSSQGRRLAGIMITLFLVFLCYGLSLLLIHGAAGIHPVLGWGVAVFLAYTTLSARSLHQEADRVKRCLEQGRIEEARRFLSGIVGRETQDLTEQEIIRAAVETVSENTSDGVIAPLFYLLIGGPPAAMAYKAVSTLDSMLGYKREHFRDLGWFPARFDDFANFIPARITGLLMVLGSLFLNLSVPGALRIMRRDGRKHDSPNAGIPEAAAAGALGVQLGGTNVYMGAARPKLHLGDPKRPLHVKCIREAVSLMYASSLLMIAFSVFIRFLLSH